MDRNPRSTRLLPLDKQLLFYVPEGPLGGTFSCPLCGAAAMQPELLCHGPSCLYAGEAASADARAPPDGGVPP